MTIVNNFEEWKSFLHERVQQAHATGLNEQTIEDVAYQIGGYLASEVNPDIPENRLLKELWESGTPEQQKALASLMVKLVEK